MTFEEYFEENYAGYDEEYHIVEDEEEEYL